MPLDVGTVEDPAAALVGTAEGASDTLPVDTLSRVFAHLGHRLPLVNKIEKRLEGQDKSAGIGSDLMALAVELFRRNEAAIGTLVNSAVEQKRTASASADAAPGPGPAVVPDPTPEVTQ